MNDITRLLNAAAEGDRGAAETLSPLIYEELRRLAVGKPAWERLGQSLQATALVHEAYLRLFSGTTAQLKAEVVKLRYFAGLAEQEIADTLQVSVATVQRWWTFARAWLYAELTDTESRWILPLSGRKSDPGMRGPEAFRRMLG